jgi:3D-(3,5/4)-trihydroxycyclohexane-1,2-dione acylhydrolase (decyclizing)
MSSARLTTAQAIINFLAAQEVERDGIRHQFFAGCIGIFGHGNLAGIGQALQERPDFRYILARNEQAAVHVASGMAKQSRRMRTLACTSSIGPGATNMVTGAAVATVNHLPVLLLPGDVFANRRPDPVLQQLQVTSAGDLSVNDCLRPVSRYFDRLTRPEQAPAALLQAMRVLTDPAETGAVTLALPQDVQAEAAEFPAELFERRVWHVPRMLPDAPAIERAVALIRGALRPVIVAGGGVHYSEAEDALRSLSEATGIPVAETQAGKGCLHHEFPLLLGSIGVTGTRAANRLARQCDLVIGLGTRYSDFTTASHTAFGDECVTFVNINVAAFDAGRFAGCPLVGDAKATLEALTRALRGFHVPKEWSELAAAQHNAWDDEVVRVCAQPEGEALTQAAVIAAVNDAAGDDGIVVNAAGSLPGDLHKLWRSHHSRSYHMEYGYSCMGYELAGAIGAKLADPDRPVIVMIGDGSWLMMPGELVTAVQEQIALICVLIDNHGFASIGSLSDSLGSGRFGTEYRFRGSDGQLSGAWLPIDYAANAASLGAAARRVVDLAKLRSALTEARDEVGPVVIVVETSRDHAVPSYDAWWDVAVAETSTMPAVAAARRAYEDAHKRERPFVKQADEGQSSSDQTRREPPSAGNGSGR